MFKTLKKKRKKKEVIWHLFENVYYISLSNDCEYEIMYEELPANIFWVFIW